MGPVKHSTVYRVSYGQLWAPNCLTGPLPMSRSTQAAPEKVSFPTPAIGPSWLDPLLLPVLPFFVASVGAKMPLLPRCVCFSLRETLKRPQGEISLVVFQRPLVFFALMPRSKRRARGLGVPGGDELRLGCAGHGGHGQRLRGLQGARAASLPLPGVYPQVDAETQGLISPKGKPLG